MGSNKNKKKDEPIQTNRQPAPSKQAQPTSRSPVPADSDIFNPSGNDPRGRVQNRILDESSRYRSQMDPFINDLGRNWGDSLGQANQDYGNIMSRYQDVAGSSPIQARSISYTDPFQSYGGYGEFSKTGGYSADDIANLRSRGVAPIRAAYSNAEREVGRQRALQGGFSPNATAVLAKMAREQSQSGADALQNVNAGIVDARNRGQLAGLAGMQGIEGQRLNAQIDTGKFNANAAMQADQYNNQNRMDALRGMSSLYGTTPGMANMFGDQLGRAIQNSGQQGTSYISGENQAQNQPGSFDNKMDRINQIGGLAGQVGAPIVDAWGAQQRRRQQAAADAQRTGIQRVQTNTNIYSNPNLWSIGQQPFMGPQQQEEEPWNPTMWG